ncbi:hypothetical protein [Devosia geojensis]|uniref:AbiU2 domain-containing protein n=1 Tax=Devosia geojensis TaxID=443610 RepID=UPI000A3E5F05|nr:hypothetical protein [Devosia geojensis]
MLGIKYGSAYYHCLQEFWRVSSNWDRYEALFGSEERVELLNSSSGHFWYTVQDMLFDHVLLGICRLTDPARMMGRENICVETLAQLDPTKHKAELVRRAAKARQKTEFARTWRHKRIGHNDLEQLSGVANLLAPATRRKVSDALVAIHDVLRWVRGRYFDGDLLLTEIGDDDANQLLIALARAKSLRETERHEIETGNYKSVLDRRARYPSADYGRERRYVDSTRLKQPRAYRGKLPLPT